MAYIRTDLRLLSVKGPDARAFLNGLITQRTDLPVGSGAYGALLTPQGKLLADFPMLFVAEDEIILALAKGLFDDLKKKLTLFKLKSDVTLTELDQPLFSQIGEPRLAFGESRHAAISHGFDASNAQPAETFHAARATLGIVEGCHDLEIGKSTLLDEGLACAIDWDKGCYMGQEVTARMRYRALIKRVMVPFMGEGQPGQALMDGGKKIGDVRSTYAGHGFAYVRKAYQGREIGHIKLGSAIGLEALPSLSEPD